MSNFTPQSAVNPVGASSGLAHFLANTTKLFFLHKDTKTSKKLTQKLTTNLTAKMTKRISNYLPTRNFATKAQCASIPTPLPPFTTTSRSFGSFKPYSLAQTRQTPPTLTKQSNIPLKNPKALFSTNQTSTTTTTTTTLKNNNNNNNNNNTRLNDVNITQNNKRSKNKAFSHVSASLADPSLQTTPRRNFFSSMAPAGVLAGGGLLVNVYNESGQTLFSQKIQLGEDLNSLSQIKGSNTTGDDNDDDGDEPILVFQCLTDDKEYILKKSRTSLDTPDSFSLSSQSASNISTSATSSSVSSADEAYARSQYSTSSQTSSSGSKSDTSSRHSRYAVGDQLNGTKYQPPSERSATTTHSDMSSQSHTATDDASTDSDDEGLDINLPDVIGAPPAQFSHPYDIKYSAAYKFLFGLKRFVSIFWTFIPFIRHYTWTHVLHTPTPADRAEMLNRLGKCIEQSGCAFIKFGQWLSMRPDIFQQDVIEVLSRLRDGAPAHKFEETREIMMEEFGVEISDMFLSFDTKAVASGSIAQVYRGKLRPEYAQKMDIRDSQGNLVDEVAIKIRHPGVLAETWIDLDIIYAIVDRVPGLCIPFNKEELKLMIQYQIDFRFEGHYLSRFRRNFSEEIQQGYIAFPYVSEESLRQAVLIESWAQGQTVGDIFTEVGDLFRPIIKKIDTPIVRHHKTLFESIRAQASSIMAIMKNYSVNGLYFLADKFDIKVDTYNAIRNRNYRSIDTKSPIANLLRAILPPRGRIGEKNYKWDPSLTQEENMRAEQKKILAYTLFDMFIKMFIRDNLIHADLHAGNVLYDHKSFKHTATVLDAGMTVALESDIMRQFGLFLRAICDGDPNSLVEACSRFEVNLPNAEFLTLLAPLSNDHSQQWSRLPIPNGSGVGLLATNSIIRSRFHHDINQIFERFYSNSAVWGADLPIAENVSIGDVVGQVLLAMQTHGIILRGDVAASIMAMSVIEGLLRQLDPELDIVVNALPYFLRYNSPFRG